MLLRLCGRIVAKGPMLKIQSALRREKKNIYIYEREMEHLEVSEWKGAEAGESLGESEALNLGCTVLSKHLCL